MELFRYSSNAWGQEVLQGMSWDLLPVFFAVGLALCVAHSLYMWLVARNKNER